MEIKIDTKEKFTVLTPSSSVLSDKIALQIATMVENGGENNVKNTILNVAQVSSMEPAAGGHLLNIYANAVQNNFSFVLCCLQPAVKKHMQETEIYDVLNITPTESEAWDMVQMEEMERELLDDGE